MQIFFLIGWWYRDDATRWMQANYPSAASSWSKAEGHFRRASYAAVIIEPGMIVYVATFCLLASQSWMRAGPCIQVSLLLILIGAY